MKPDWDKLMKNWNKGDRAKTSLIADVDCTTDGGKALCEQAGVRGYPTIKWGDAANLEDYEGGRSYDDLKKFAKQNLKPRCSPANLDLCDDAKKKEIADIQALPADELTAKIDAKKKEIKDAEEHFEKSVKELQATYEKLQKDKEGAIKAVKESGLGLMQAVQSHAKKAKEEL
jgi:hypothetical protein